MASFTASSICFIFQTAEVSHGKSHVGKASSSCLPSYSEVVTAGFRNSVSKLDVKVCEEAQRRVQCMAQQTVSPLLEFSERADSSFALPTLASSPSTLVESGHYWSSPAEVQPAISGSSLSQGDTFGGVSIASLMEPVAEDLQILNRNLHTVVGSENPLLMAAAEQIFSAGGKRMRPALVLLVSKATAQLAGAKDLSPQHRRLAEVIEMIHTASLIHDDVLDESDVRRGKETIHQLFGTRVAVLAGDFLFAQSSWYLASLENIEVIKLISQVIKDLASGEIKQASSLFDCDTTLQDYLDKSYYKTASLVAASTRGAAIFSGVSAEVCDKMFGYGTNLGLAFQIVDDLLDFTQSTEQLGKPAGSDLSKGNLTAPVLFALEDNKELRRIIDSEFTDEGSLETAIKLVQQGRGMVRARDLAKQKGEEAKDCLKCLLPGVLRSSLEGMVDYVLKRLY
ncbi:hypothetical protein L7F22_049190 [Adiantum nelumboides]|nr:hypothetical protein [Adiantum nelumboides]